MESEIAVPYASNMNACDLRIAHRRRPFQPFVIHMENGLTYPVLHPHNLAIHASLNMVAVWEHDAEDVVFLAIGRITTLSPLLDF